MVIPLPGSMVTSLQTDQEGSILGPAVEFFSSGELFHGNEWSGCLCLSVSFARDLPRSSCTMVTTVPERTSNCPCSYMRSKVYSSTTGH